MWDRRSGEPLCNAIVWQDTRTDVTGARARRRGGRRPAARARSGCRSRPTSPARRSAWILDSVDGRPRARRGGRAGLRHDRQLGAVEPHRRTGRRRPCDRRDQRQPHDADGPADARLARAEPRADGRSRAAMLPEIRSSSEVYGEAAGHGARRPAGGGHRRRPAGGAVRPDLLPARRGEEHLRHRLLPARQHGRRRSSAASGC